MHTLDYASYPRVAEFPQLPWLRQLNVPVQMHTLHRWLYFHFVRNPQHYDGIDRCSNSCMGFRFQQTDANYFCNFETLICDEVNFSPIGQKINKSTSTSLNKKSTSIFDRQSTKTPFFTILTLNTGYCTLCENSRKTVAKGSSHHIFLLQPIENLLGSFYFSWTKTLLSSVFL